MFSVCLILSNQKVYAEQTIINIPSSEVLPAENIIFKESNRFNSHLDNGTTTLTPSVIFGVGHGLEFATGVGTTFNDNNIIRGNFSAKKVFFLGSSTRLTVGGSINPYFSANSTPDSFLYTHLSQRIKKTRTSLTAGAYVHGQKSMPNEDFNQEEFDSLLKGEKNLIGAKLEEANLQGMDLSGRDFSGADLEKANLQNANLTNTIFKNTDLEKANLKGAKIIGAIFKGAELEFATWV
ncbi:MAG: pentapeptide repeat-containing protein, partial [bacterium]